MALERSGRSCATLTLPVLLLVLTSVLSVPTMFVIPNTNRNNLFYRHVSRQTHRYFYKFLVCFLVMSSHFSLNRQLYHCSVEQATIPCKRTGTSPHPSSGIFHLCFCTNLSITAQRNYTLMCKCPSVSRFRQHLGFFRKEL